MKRYGDVFRDWATYVTESGDWRNAQSYFLSVHLYKRGWRLVVIGIREIMFRVKNESQASKASRLLDEFLPMNTPPKILLALRKLELRMYERVGSSFGIRKCLTWEASQLPEGRLFLKAMHKQTGGESDVK
jgi:hypothetical protein